MAEEPTPSTKELGGLQISLFQKNHIGPEFYTTSVSASGKAFSQQVKNMLEGIDPTLLLSRDLKTEQEVLSQLPNDIVLLYILLCKSDTLSVIEQTLANYLESEDSNQFTERFIIVIRNVMVGR